MGEIITRSELNIPDFDEPGGLSLYNKVKAMYTTLGDNANARLYETLGFGNGTTQDYNHNLRCKLTDIVVKLYTLTQAGSGPVTKVSITAGGTTAKTNDTYIVSQSTGEISTSGSGTGLELSIVVESGTIIRVSVLSQGTGHAAADIITVNTIDGTPMSVAATLAVTSIDDNQYDLIRDTSSYTIVGKTGDLYKTIQITNNTGGSVDIAVIIIGNPTYIDNIKDVDVSSTAPEDGQALVWNGSSWVPGASGDSSLKLQSVDGTDLNIKSGYLILADGREIRLASDLAYDLSGITTDGDYYVYVNMNKLITSTTINGREVYNIDSDFLELSTTTPQNAPLSRLVPIGAVQRSAGTWQNPQTLATRRHDFPLGTDGSLEYQKAYAAVGNVGDANNFKAGHDLLVGSFPSGVDASFYNLEDANDDSTNGRNLTNNGTIPFTATGILGITNSAASLNGSSQYFSSTNADFNPGNSDFTVGGWFYSSDWSPATDQMLFAQWPDGSNKSFALRINADGTLNLYTSVDGTTEIVYPIIISELVAGFHHFALKYIASDNKFYVYVDSVVVGVATLSAGLNSNTTPSFSIGSYFGGSSYFAGSVDEFFFVTDSALSDNALHKVYAAKISHNRLMTAQTQKWFAWGKDSGINLPIKNYIVDMGLNDLYVDFSQYLSTTEIELKLYNGGSVGSAKASKQRSLELEASELDALLPLTHNMGVVPEITFKVDDGTGDYIYQDHGSIFKASSTQIKIAGSSLATLFGATSNVVLNFSSGVVSQYRPDKIYNTYVQASSTSVNSFDQIFADTSGGAITLTLPASPSLGDTIEFIDFDGSFGTNNLTIDRNGNNIDGAASNLVKSTNGNNVKLCFNGTDDWRIV